MSKTWITLLVTLVTLNLTLAAVDQTIVTGAKGQDVVEAVLSKIYSSFIFLDDFDILKRIALAETHFGENAMEYQKGGGIWQLTERRFNKTKDVATNPQLISLQGNISTTFSIDWLTVTYSDLTKPLHSGLGARLFLETIVEDQIPQQLWMQADYWYKYYANDDTISPADFNDTVSDWEIGNRCTGKMDLLVVMDESGSISSGNWKKSISFAADLFDSYSLQSVRESLITFSGQPRVKFELNNNMTADEIRNFTLGLGQGLGDTYTNDAIKAAVDLFERADERPGIPKIMALVTDGQSNDGNLSNVALAKEAEIVSFSVGIGDYEMEELETIAYGDLTRVFTMDDFDALTEFFNRLNSATCSIPQKPSLNDTTVDTLSMNQKRFYEFFLPKAGMTVMVTTTQGQVSGFYSFFFQNPSSAINDGELNTQLETLIVPPDNSITSVFVTIKGVGATNNYTIEGSPADSVKDPPTTTTTEAGSVPIQPLVLLVLLMAIISCY